MDTHVLRLCILSNFNDAIEKQRFKCATTSKELTSKELTLKELTSKELTSKELTSKELTFERTNFERTNFKPTLVQMVRDTLTTTNVLA